MCFYLPKFISPPCAPAVCGASGSTQEEWQLLSAGEKDAPVCELCIPDLLPLLTEQHSYLNAHSYLMQTLDLTTEVKIDQAI